MIRSPKKRLSSAREGEFCAFSQPGTLRLRQPDVFTKPTSDSCLGFLNRVLSLDFVLEVDIHPQHGVAEIKFIEVSSSAAVLKRLAVVLRQTGFQAAQFADRLHLGRGRLAAIRVFRYP